MFSVSKAEHMHGYSTDPTRKLHVMEEVLPCSLAGSICKNSPTIRAVRCSLFGQLARCLLFGP